MARTSEIPAGRISKPVEHQALRVAAYCRVSTEHEEQETSLEMQEAHFRAIIEENPNWKNAGIFLKSQWPEFKRAPHVLCPYAKVS